MNRTLGIAVLAVFFLSLGANITEAAPRLVVVSDVDDTIALTNIHPQGHYLRFVRNLIRSNDAFTGMANLYTVLAGAGVDVRYLSSAIEKISFLPEKFLQASGFPAGDLYLRPNRDISGEEFKIARLRELMSEQKDAQFILIGDNGEKDIRAYEHIQKDPELGPRVLGVFIHKVYGRSVGMALKEGQDAFFTAGDLALGFYERGLLSNAQLDLILEQVNRGLTSRFASVRERAYPFFAPPLSRQEQTVLSHRIERMNDPVLREKGQSMLASLKQRQLSWTWTCSEWFISLFR